MTIRISNRVKINGKNRKWGEQEKKSIRKTCLQLHCQAWQSQGFHCLHPKLILVQFCTTKKSLWYTFVPEKRELVQFCTNFSGRESNFFSPEYSFPTAPIAPKDDGLFLFFYFFLV